MVEKRGRKAAADLGVVPIMPGDAKPAPPEDMAELEADVWRMVVNAMPLRHFGRETWPVLVGLCKQVVVRDEIGRRLDQVIAKKRWKHSEIAPMYDLYSSACRQVRQHSADLRLTKIAQLPKQVVVDAAVRNQALKKPWQI